MSADWLASSYWFGPATVMFPTDFMLLPAITDRVELGGPTMPLPMKLAGARRYASFELMS